MSNGLIEVLNHPIRSLIGGSCDYGEFFLCLGGNRQESTALITSWDRDFPCFFARLARRCFCLGFR